MSRLLTNGERIRESLEARNLYNPERPYDVSFVDTASAINNIVDIVNPFTSFDLSNTVLGRLIGQNTPLAQIGLQMLARQFGATAASNATADYLPAIKFENLFDGDPNTKFLSVKKDFRITRRETQNNIGKILQQITGNYPLKEYPFTPSSDNIDFIKNSGIGQLQLLTRDLNQNKYKPSSQEFQSTLRQEGLNYGNIEEAAIIDYFSGDNIVFHPYNDYKISKTVDIFSINNRLNAEVQNFRTVFSDKEFYLEYGATQLYVDSLGKTNVEDFREFEEKAKYNYGLEDDDRLRLVWGRDGVDSNYSNSTLGFDDPLNGTQPSENGGRIGKSSRFSFVNNEDIFNMEAGGLLSYTRELLNTKGRYSMFDLTKKKFIDTDEQIHFNGSPLRKTVDGIEDKNRQHNVADPYDNYVKAIRFNGNKIYNGNPNSVIYEKVIPQVVPTIGGVNKNLMFSIENLAMVVNGNDDDNSTYAVVDDEFGTELPLCEKGPANGRLMWFPPYAIELSENVVVNRNTTNFIGRGEPVYTYSNTERLANLSFKLIIDYPPNVRGLSHVDASRFFAFGGDAPLATSNLGDKIKRREDLISQRKNIKPTKENRPPDIPTKSTDFFFLNDQPTTNNINSVINSHLTVDFYEVENSGNVGGTSGRDGKNFNLNVPFQNEIDNLIDEYLIGDTKDFVEIYLEGSASTLFNAANGADYNQRLSERRIESVKSYIRAKYKEKTGKDLANSDKKIFIEEALGQVGGTATDEASEISDLASKEARKVYIEFRYNGKESIVDVPINEKEREDLDRLNRDIAALDTEISKQKRGTNLTGCEFNPYTIQDGILKGFESTEKNMYKPAFHSQTPEDFHRRLTFLHQCTRQGEAVRKTRGGDDTTFSASNAVFGRQPVQILRLGDFFHTKIVIDNMQIDYSEAPWDMNPEGMGMQFMMADVKLQIKIIGGQSLKGPINALQNAVSYNYYANSTFYNDGVYANATNMETLQYPPNNNPTDNKNAANEVVNNPIEPSALEDKTPNS